MRRTAEERASHPVDRHVGRQIRELRWRVNISQEELAQRLGLTFQQVQKYERAYNRVSASKLFELAGVFGVDVGYLFRGLALPAASEARSDGGEAAVHAPMTAEAEEIDRLFQTLGRRRRRLVLDTARALARHAGATFTVTLDEQGVSGPLTEGGAPDTAPP